MKRSIRHQPNFYLDYVDIHVRAMGQMLYIGAVDKDEINLLTGADGRVYFSGYAILRDEKLKLDVTKELEVTDASNPKNPLVPTISYSYNVSLIGRGNVFRYCSPHPGGDDAPEHHGHHHRHQFDRFGPTPEEYTVTWDTDGEWPTLAEVIKEADAWYWDNVHRL